MSIKDRIAALNKASAEQAKPNVAVKKDVVPPSIATVTSPVAKAIIDDPKSPIYTEKSVGTVSSSPFLNKQTPPSAVISSTNNKPAIASTADSLSPSVVLSPAKAAQNLVTPSGLSKPAVTPSKYPVTNKPTTPIAINTSKVTTAAILSPTVDNSTVFGVANLKIAEVETGDTTIKAKGATETTGTFTGGTNNLHSRSITDANINDPPAVTNSVKSLRMNLGNIPMPGMGRPMSMPLMSHRTEVLPSASALGSESDANGELVHVSDG